MTAPAPDEREQLARFESFAKADPDNALIWISLGDLQHRAGRLDEATASFERALLADPDNEVAAGRLASVRISRHDFAGAERVLRGLLEAGTEDPALRHNLGITLLHQRRFEEALQIFDEIGDALDVPGTLLYRAQAHHQLGDTERAVGYARAWASRVPSDRAEGYVALLEFDNGDIASARPRAEAVLGRDPNNIDASVVIGTLMAEQQEMRKAEALFRHAVELEPDNPRGWMGLGLMFLYRREFQTAIQTLEKARSLQPDNVGLVVTIGWARLMNGDPVGAEATFREAIAVDRTFGEAHGGLAVVLITLGREDEARTSIRRARGLSPIGFGYVYAESILLARGGQQDEATHLLTGVFERRATPNGPTLIEAVQTFLRHEAARAEPAGARAIPSSTSHERELS